MFDAVFKDDNLALAELAARRVVGRSREGRRRLRFRRRENVEQRRDATLRDLAVFDVRVVLNLVLEPDPALAVRLLDLVLDAAVASAPEPPFERKDVIRKAFFRQEIAAVRRVDHSKKTVFDAPTGARSAARFVRPTVEVFAVEKGAFRPDRDLTTADFKRFDVGGDVRFRRVGGRGGRSRFAEERRTLRNDDEILRLAAATAKRRQQRERSERTGTKKERKSALEHRIILKICATVNVDARRSGNDENGRQDRGTGKRRTEGEKRENAKNAASGESASLFALKSAPPSRPLKSAAA